MTEADDAVVIVGAGHAGDAAAAHLRQYGFAGKVVLLGDEGFVPYHRPPLSKAWLKGEADEAALALRAADFYARQHVDLRLGVVVQAIEREARHVRLADGKNVNYTHLILALGARPRTLPLPGHDLPHVHALRTRADADALRGVLRPGARLVVIGGGYIGLEIAASARALGVEATVLEREARLLARVASVELASFLHALHAARGVRVVLEAGVDAIEAGAVRLADGTSPDADVVLVGVGAVPNTELAEAAGLACENGIVVDEVGRTSDPHVFAIGDCTSRPVALYGRRMRLESVPSALEQARQAACAITGRAAPAAEVPWFWSDQYEARLQIAGLLLDVARSVVREENGKFSAFHLGADGTVRAVEAVNAPESFMAGRVMIGRRTIPDAAALADPAVPMPAIVAKATPPRNPLGS